MEKVESIKKGFFNVVLYVAIVVGIMWGVPQLLSWNLGTPYPIAAITSGSMWPALKKGDVVLIKYIPKEEMRVGDIVVWRNEKGFTIHRVVTLDEQTLTTKGDANFSEDAPVHYGDVVWRTVMFQGTPFRIPYVGFVSLLRQGI